MAKKVKVIKDVADTSESYAAKCDKVLASTTASADLKAKATALKAAIVAHTPNVAAYNATLASPNALVSAFNAEVDAINTARQTLNRQMTQEAQAGTLSIADVQRIGVRV